jgi:hypothetical protein
MGLNSPRPIFLFKEEYMWTKKRLATVFLLVLVGRLQSQTISPVVVECGKKCSGYFTVTNNLTIPNQVILTPKSFSLDKATGRSVFRELDKTVDLQLDQMSARVAPKDAHNFFYKMKCSAYPCLVTVMTLVSSGQKSDEGMHVIFALPFVLYQCAAEKNCRANARKAAGLQ